VRLAQRRTVFVNQKDVEAHQALQQLPCGTIRQRGIHFIEQILCLYEPVPFPSSQRLKWLTSRSWIRL
jgi:hypothetical protein